MPRFSQNNWTSFYLNLWGKQIVLSTENTLAHEYDLVDKRMSLEGKSIQDQNAIKTLKKELEDLISIDQMPIDVQEEFVRAKLNIAPHFWQDYDAETKGKTIAIEIIKSQLERIHKFYSHMENEKKKKNGKS